MQRIHVNGIVQGVGFRPFIYRLASERNLKGYVRNLGDAGVEVVLDCSEAKAQEFVKSMLANLPPLARIYDVQIEDFRAPAQCPSFKILESLDSKEGSGSVIPPDIGMCDKCLVEMRNPKDKRHNYFFTTCTDCGPRFTIIDKLPYDRPHTSMRDFPMDAGCAVEYKNPLDRRYHAQTVACKDCGPKAWIADKNGKIIENATSEDAIWRASELLSEGAIFAIKGNGGFHLAAATSLEAPVSLLRQRRNRKQQPFAVMARGIEAVKTFAQVSAEEEKILTSSLRPIVILNKSKNYGLAESVAPGLHNIGVMLPYTGMHHLLFDRTKEKAFVMTSANLPGDPMVMGNDEAVQKLGNIVDYFLFHNREIVQRCDDSVIRQVAGEQAFIRRSRGWAPAPVEISEKFNGNGKNILALGAELCVASCILNGKRAFLSQHIGDVEKPDTLAFLEDATRRLIHLTNTKPEAIVCDLHPQFATTRLARRMSEEFAIPLKQVQHHWAHAASILAEHGINECVSIITDGVGYGADGHVWGGEVLYASTDKFERLGHLQEQPMPGGDLATKWPLRIAAGMLGEEYAAEFLAENAQELPHGKTEADVIIKQLGAGKLPMTTSCGRVLDAASAALGICRQRTYEGEPAMKLESAAMDGKDALALEPEIRNGILYTSNLISAIYENRSNISKRDLAYSAHTYLAKGLARIAAEEAEKRGFGAVGFSGGCAYNEILVSEVKRELEKQGLKLMTNTKVPRGDGGVALGQALLGRYL